MPSIRDSIIDMTKPALSVENISVSFRRQDEFIPAVHDVSFAIYPKETLALVGESGSGKSVTNLAVMRLTPPAPRTEVKGSLPARMDRSRISLPPAIRRCGPFAATRSP
jgi:ABC-type dipeptide/oligopeptide/nickel transport system ATPase component